MSEPTIEHSIPTHRFQTRVDGKLAYTEYSMDGRTLTFTHTQVPKELEGRGLASKIVKFALDEARSKKFKVVAQCPYVSSYIQRNPEYQDLLGK
jgi:predicted GNAT family acetyltransferase